MEYKSFPLEIKKEEIDSAGLFKGYASTFGGSPDSYGDIVVEGAFSRSLSAGGRNGFGIPLLWQHKSDEPIGIWSLISENKKGLQVEGQLALNTTKGKDTYELMKMGAVKGLSIGFNPVEDGYSIDDKKKIRYLNDIDLWEISVVTFPANTRAHITAVKSIESAINERDLERALREAGLSNSESKLIVKMCRPALLNKKDTPDIMILNALREVNASIKAINQNM